jgi:hypothetical protein
LPKPVAAGKIICKRNWISISLVVVKSNKSAFYFLGFFAAQGFCPAFV